MGGILFRCYDCDYWLVRHQIVCPSCKRRYRSPSSQEPSWDDKEQYQDYVEPFFHSQLSPNQEEALDRLSQHPDVKKINWAYVFEDLTEVDDAVVMLWDQLYRVAAPMAQNPEITDPNTFFEFVQAAGRLSGGLEALKSIFPYNQFELENEKQELTNFIDHLEKLHSGAF